MSNRVFGWALTTVAAISAFGCAADTSEPAEPAGPAPLTATIVGSDGSTTTSTGSWDEVFWAGYTEMPTFVVDGHEVEDPAHVLSGERIELAMADGSTLVLGRVDGALTMLEGPEENVGRDLRVTFGESSMIIEGPDGVAEVHLAAENAERVRSYLGRCAIELLGGYAGLDGVEQGRDLVTLGIVGIVAVSLAYGTCITAGQAICLSEAERACRRFNGVRRAKMICGAGFDFEGRIQLGSHCAYECRQRR